MPTQLEAESRLRVAQINVAGARQHYSTLTTVKTKVDQLSLDLAALQVAASQAQTQAEADHDAAVLGNPSVLPALTIASTVDDLLRKERFAGKAASVDFIKANPACTEAEAEAAWSTAALLATGRPALVVPVGNYASLYRENLLALGLVADLTHEAQRAWIIATPTAVIMSA